MLGLYDVLRKAACLLFRLCQIIEKGAAVFRLDLCTGFAESCDRCICFAVTALLHEKILLLASEILELGEILQFRTKFLVSEVLANVDPLLQKYRIAATSLSAFCEVAWYSEASSAGISATS